MQLDVFTDGGARGNPGPAAIGIAIYERGTKNVPLKTISQFLGSSQTNNEAEYQAVIAALTALNEFSPQEANFYLDSELVVKQLNGEYKVKQPHLKEFYNQIKSLSTTIPMLKFDYIPRAKNKVADALVNQALDAHAAQA